jgi:tRNA (guanine37-N1)-methyltransferase
MFFEIITLFPAMFDGPFSDSIIKRAADKGLVSIRFVNFRDFADDRHRTVDDTPYGGDPGMLLKPEPLAAAITESTTRLAGEGKTPFVVCLSAQGRLLTHELVEELGRKEALVIVCGHYKGVDQRVIDKFANMEVSVGDYVVSGGEIPAMIIVDAVTRLIPGALGNPESAERDSFYSGLLGCPQYTRPETWEGRPVPQVLMSGHHENIRQWQREQSVQLTKERRPDLWEKYEKRRELQPPKSPGGGLVRSLE